MSKPSQAQNASMDEILSSIRSIVKEEEQRPGSTPDADDDILELTEVMDEPEMVEAEEAEAATEEFVDINAFAATGETVAADEAAVEAARQKYESETAPVSDEQKPATELPSTDELLAEMADESLVEKAVTETAEAAEAAQAVEAAPVAAEQPAVEDSFEETPLAQPKPAEAAAPVAAAPLAGKPVSLKAVPGAQGLQVAFPVEVLAEALRPMIKDWVEDNLPTIVEKLVREELSRLVDKQ